jgi:hypothetical protein
VTTDRGTPEKVFQQGFVALLEAHRYVVDHTYPLRTRDGWRTGSTLKGKPDLLALRPPWLLAIELKAEGGTLAEVQRAVLSVFAGLPMARAWVLRETAPTRMLQTWIAEPEAAPAVHGFEVMDLVEARQVIALSRLRRRPSRRGSRGEASGQLPLG